MIEVKLLGPPRVEADGTAVTFDTRKAVAVLAFLAVSDRPRPRDLLADLLWPDHDVQHARGALRRTLSTLRSAVGAEHLEANRDHVRLVKGVGLQVDVDCFRDLVGSGDLEAAVAIFGGDFLEGFAVRDSAAFEAWADAEAHALRLELTGALGRLADVRDRAGDPAGAMRTVRRWLELDPLAEPAHRALIRLYAAAGDRASALGQYRECVRTLSRELGVPPLRETTELYEAIASGEVHATPPTAPLPPATPVTIPFVGREAELRALLEGYASVGPQGRVVLVEGEAGIGKTRLAEELLSQVAERGGAVLQAQAYEDEGTLAYGPVVDVLKARLQTDPTVLSALPPRVLGDVGRLVAGVAEGVVADQAAPLEGPGAEARFLSAVWDALEAAADGPVPGVLHLDDAQWADEATLALLAFGLRRLARRPLLVVLTWRTPHDNTLRRTAAATARSGGGVVVRLEPLDVQAVTRIAAAMRPDTLDAQHARRLHDATQGNPLLLVEYLRGVGPEDGEWTVPVGVRDVLRGRVDGVGETARQVLAGAAVIGRSFDARTVQVVSGRSEEETVDAIEELVGRGLVREAHSGYDFCHDQLRQLVYDDTGAARRRLLHGRAAAALSRTAAAAARHLELAGRDDEAAQAHALAADEARAVHANATAMDHLLSALALGHPDPCTLHAAVGDLQVLGGDYAQAVTSYETAAARCSAEQLGELEHRLGQVHHRRGDWSLAAAHLTAAMSATAPERLGARARITADLALAAHAARDRDRARDLGHDALLLAEDADDPAALGQVHNLLGMLAGEGGEGDEALRHLETSRALAHQVGDVGALVAVLNNLALVHRRAGALDPALQLTRDALDLCARQGDRHREAALHNNLADLLHAAGEPEEAMRHLKLAVAIFAEVGVEGEPRPEVWKLVRW